MGKGTPGATAGYTRGLHQSLVDHAVERLGNNGAVSLKDLRLTLQHCVGADLRPFRAQIHRMADRSVETWTVGLEVKGLSADQLASIRRCGVWEACCQSADQRVDELTMTTSGGCGTRRGRFLFENISDMDANTGAHLHRRCAGLSRDSCRPGDSAMEKPLGDRASEDIQLDMRTRNLHIHYHHFAAAVGYPAWARFRPGSITNRVPAQGCIRIPCTLEGQCVTEQTVCKDDPVHSLTCLLTQLAVYSDVCDYQVLGDLRRGASRLCQVDVGSSNTFDSIKAKIPSKEGIFRACSGRSIWKGAVCDLVWLPRVRDTFCISCARIEALFSFLEAHRKKTAEVWTMTAPSDEYSAQPLHGFEANEPPKATKCLDAVEVDPG